MWRKTDEEFYTNHCFLDNIFISLKVVQIKSKKATMEGMRDWVMM